MNRRDFLKMLGLALSALALPKVRGLPTIKSKPALTGTSLQISSDGVNWTELPGATLKDFSVTGRAAAKDLRAMAEAAGEAAKGLRAQSLQDCIPISHELLDAACAGPITYEDIHNMLDRHERPQTLMGYPIVYKDDGLQGIGELTFLPFEHYAKQKTTLCWMGDGTYRVVEEAMANQKHVQKSALARATNPYDLGAVHRASLVLRYSARPLGGFLIQQGPPCLWATSKNPVYRQWATVEGKDTIA